MLKPLNDRVVLEIVEQEKVSSGGLVLTSMMKEKSQNGTVVAVGSGYILENGDKMALSVAVGDRVIFEENAGTVVGYQGKDYLVMREKDIIAVVE